MMSLNTLRNSQHFATPPLFSPRNDISETSAEISMLMTGHHPAVSSASDWLKQISSQTDPDSDASSGWSF